MNSSITLCLLAATLITPFAHAQKGKKQPELPVLAGGKGEGYHAYYEGDNYIAKVDSSGALELTLKDAGQASVAGSVPMNDKKMWSIDIAPGVYDTKWKKRINQPLAEFLEQSPPSDDTTKVRILSMRTTGILFETIYEFSPETISTWYRAEKDSQTPETQILMLSHRINRIECSDKDRKKCRYQLKPTSGKTLKFDFLESVKASGRDSKSISIEGPFWGKREITFDRGKDKDAVMRPVKYGDVSLRNGSEIWLAKEDPSTSNHEKERVTITIE